MSTSLVRVTADSDFRRIEALVLNAVQSPSTRTMYAKGLGDFFKWWEERGRPEFSRETVQSHRTALQKQKYAPSTINQRLAAIKKLAREAAANGLLSAEAAASIQAVDGAKQSGHRVGKWLEPDEAAALIDAPDVSTMKGKRDRALLALLVGCGLRRGEAANLTCGHIQVRASRVLIVDMRGKHGRIRTITVPDWVYAAVHQWCTAADIRQTEERVLRSIARRRVHDERGRPVAGQYTELVGDRLTPEAILLIVAGYARKLGFGSTKPHDLRRTCAKLCRRFGADLEQIQMLLGHASIQTTERYLGSRQNLERGPNDLVQLPLANRG
jgi:site-specific recombinase XerD